MRLGNIFDDVDPTRPNEIVEYIVTSSRLAAAAALYASGSPEQKRVLAVLGAAQRIVSAEAWYAADAARGTCPAALAGEQIGELHVQYPAAPIPQQRRYAPCCIFSLPKLARHAACHGLYVDGDLVGSELVCLQHACHKLGIDCDNLDEHMANREAQLAALGVSHCDRQKFSAPERRDFAKAYVNSVVHGAALLPSAPGTTANAAAELFAKYGVLPSARPPLWLKNLKLEMAVIGPAIVAAPAHKPTMDALRAHPDVSKRAKANRWQSAMHYVLAPYEFDMIDAAVEFGDETHGMLAISDQSDGMYWLAHSFPAGESRADVFAAMSQHIATVTGIADATIREKPIPLPELPAPKTEFFSINEWSNDTTLAQLPQVMKRLDRHFTALQGMTKAFIVEQYFYPNSDTVAKTILRTVAETKLIYQRCTVIVKPAKSDDDEPKRKSVFDLWLADPKTNVKQTVDFLATPAERASRSRAPRRCRHASLWCRRGPQVSELAFELFRPVGTSSSRHRDISICRERATPSRSPPPPSENLLYRRWVVSW